MEEFVQENSFIIVVDKETHKFACDFPGCEKAYARRHALNEHVRTHTGERKLNCDLCDKSFFTADQKYKHTESVHSMRIFKCDVCEKVFKKKTNLSIHMQGHNGGGKKYECARCCSNFLQASDLRKHERIHSDAEPFSCDVCGMRFKWKNSLRRHEKSHTSSRPHKCDTCDMTFIQKCDLTKHLNTHDTKGVSCSICKEVFTRLDSLRRHYKVHKLSIGCPVSECNLSFPSKHSLVQHFKSNHSRSEVEAVSPTSFAFLDRSSDEDQEDVDNPADLVGPLDILLDQVDPLVRNHGIFVDKSDFYAVDEGQGYLEAEFTLNYGACDLELEEHVEKRFVIDE